MKKIGIIGGSGLENIKGLDFYKSVELDTPYGSPSDEYRVYKNENVEIYSLSRHGKNHEFAPHNINYKANIYGFYKAGVEEIISFSATGGINPDYKTGDLVLTSDAIDNTNRGSVTMFNDKGHVVHIDMSNPFCLSVRNKLKQAADNAEINLITEGVYICTDGPRFETPAEIKMYRMWGADMAGMTLFPEVTLSKEMGICYANISLITNSASGMEENKKLTSSEVIDEAAKSADKILKIIYNYINLKERGACTCKDILKGALISK